MTASLYDIPLTKLDGSAATLAEHRGQVLGRFAPDVAPDAPVLVAAIEAALA